MKNIITKTGISIFVLIFMQSCVSVSMISSISGVKQKILTDENHDNEDLEDIL